MLGRVVSTSAGVAAASLSTRVRSTTASHIKAELVTSVVIAHHVQQLDGVLHVHVGVTQSVLYVVLLVSHVHLGHQSELLAGPDHVLRQRLRSLKTVLLN